MTEEPDKLPEIRASDAERAEIADQLGTAVGEGRLTLDEFTQRVSAAYEAKTRTELDRLVVDLPATRPTPVPAPRPTVGSVEPVRSRRKWMFAIMGGINRKGSWQIPERVSAIMIMGGCDLDLRKAVIAAPEVHITIVAIMGGGSVIVPPGVRVEVDGFSFMGGKDVKVDDESFVRNSPTIHIHGYMFMGGLDIKTKAVKEK